MPVGQELETLADRVRAGESVFAVHYASESFLEVQTEPMAIAAIAVHDLQRNVTISFTRLDAPAGVDKEVFLLEAFFDFLSANRDTIFLHWNMGSAEYGFEVIAKRYFYLKQETPAVSSPSERIDVDKLIRAKYGHDYAPHGRLQSIARLNDLDLRGFLPGGEEAAAFKVEKWNDVGRSSATKARLIADLFSRLISGQLRTNNSAGRFQFGGGELDAVSTVLAIGEKFLLVQRSLSRRSPSNRPPLEFADEYDDQYLMRALLVQYFDDVRPEDYVPTYAGGNSRVDFLLPEYGLAIELKHTRNGLDDRHLGEELVIDSQRYRNANKANHLLVLVFDHDGRLTNPRGLERDLQRSNGDADLAVTVRILDR